MPVLVRSLTSSILSSTSVQLDDNFWRVGRTALEQLRCAIKPRWLLRDTINAAAEQLNSKSLPHKRDIYFSTELSIWHEHLCDCFLSGHFRKSLSCPTILFRKNTSCIHLCPVQRCSMCSGPQWNLKPRHRCATAPDQGRESRMSFRGAGNLTPLYRCSRGSVTELAGERAASLQKKWIRKANNFMKSFYVKLLRVKRELYSGPNIHVPTGTSVLGRKKIRAWQIGSRASWRHVFRTQKITS